MPEPTEPSQSQEDRATVVSRMLLKESDRGCAIFGASILHDELERLLRAFLRSDEASVKKVVDPLFQGYAPLATFSSRINVAFAMRLITRDLWRRLEAVRKLRNDFAHESGPIEFDDPRCSERLRFLIADGKPKSRIEEADMEPRMIAGQVLSRVQFVNRVAFVVAVSTLAARLEFLREAMRDGRPIHAVVDALERGAM